MFSKKHVLESHEYDERFVKCLTASMTLTGAHLDNGMGTLIMLKAVAFNAPLLTFSPRGQPKNSKTH